MGQSGVELDLSSFPINYDPSDGLVVRIRRDDPLRTRLDELAFGLESFAVRGWDQRFIVADTTRWSEEDGEIVQFHLRSLRPPP